MGFSLTPTQVAQVRSHGWHAAFAGFGDATSDLLNAIKHSLIGQTTRNAILWRDCIKAGGVDSSSCPSVQGVPFPGPSHLEAVNATRARLWNQAQAEGVDKSRVGDSLQQYYDAFLKAYLEANTIGLQAYEKGIRRLINEAKKDGTVNRYADDTVEMNFSEGIKRHQALMAWNPLVYGGYANGLQAAYQEYQTLKKNVGTSGSSIAEVQQRLKEPPDISAWKGDSWEDYWSKALGVKDLKGVLPDLGSFKWLLYGGAALLGGLVLYKIVR